MRLRHLYQRTRPFRYVGFWLMGVVVLLAGPAVHAATQLLLGVLFCALWPPGMDWLHRRLPAAAAAADVDRCFYVAECGAAALALSWVGVPALAAATAVICLLGGATALAGWRLLLAAVVAVSAGALLGMWSAPGPALVHVTGGPLPAADLVALAGLLGFALALADLAFRQAQRLDAQRQALMQRTAALERLNDRMQRYLPPSLRQRLAAAPEAPCRWERRWLTVVFVDLVGFTELAERLEAEPLAAVLDEYLGALIPAAEARQGEVSKVLGDGILVAFGLREGADRRLRADAALGFCHAVPALLAQLAVRWRSRGELVTLRVRAGVASGYCTLGDRGGAGRLDFTLVGSPVNLASRLQVRADADAALVDAATAALAENGCGLGPARLIDLKGLGRVPAHGLALGTRRVDPTAPSAIVPAPLVLP